MNTLQKLCLLVVVACINAYMFETNNPLFWIVAIGAGIVINPFGANKN